MREANHKQKKASSYVQTLTLSRWKQRAGRSEAVAEGAAQALNEGRLVGDKVGGKDR